jgi:hypothetical protein
LAGSDEEAKDRLTDALHFALWIHQNLPGVDLSVSHAPVLFLTDQKGEYEITLTHGSAAFSVRGNSLAMPETEGERMGIVRGLLTHWKTLVGHLPEGFIIYGPDANPMDVTYAAREKLLQTLGFAPSEADGTRFGIVRNGEVTPLTAFQHKELTGEDNADHLYAQRLCVERIVWPGEEVG